MIDKLMEYEKPNFMAALMRRRDDVLYELWNKLNEVIVAINDVKAATNNIKIEEALPKRGSSSGKKTSSKKKAK